MLNSADYTDKTIQLVSAGDLKLRPETAALWDREKNAAGPESVRPSSHKLVWWRCSEGHSWQQKVYAVSAGSGCPYCNGRRAIPGRTDLLTTQPALALEWDDEKNAGDASCVSAGSAVKAWWKCPEGHSYQAAVYARVSGNGCPYCTGKKVLAGFNDLMTTDPAVAREWDRDKNGEGPETANRGSHRQVWWRCGQGHSYLAPIFGRIAGNGCPYCAGRKVLAGFNDLATTHPVLVKQWAFDLNGSEAPETVSKGSNKKVWWRCTEGHVWQAAVFSRTRKKASGCPICAGKMNVKFESRYRRDTARLRPADVRERERPAV